jgi:hypothetical protein
MKNMNSYLARYPDSLARTPMKTLNSEAKGKQEMKNVKTENFRSYYIKKAKIFFSSHKSHKQTPKE